MMKPEEIQNVLELSEKATPGPWEPYSSYCCSDMGGVVGTTSRICPAEMTRHPMTIEDAEFVAASREAIPKLVAHVRSLESQLSLAEKFHDLAVKERDYERHRVDRLEQQLRSIEGHHLKISAPMEVTMIMPTAGIPRIPEGGC